MSQNNNSPLISIIVPVYKVEKYLIECIESIRKQTLNNIEIILIDDGSPDNCPQICDDFKCKDSRIKVIHQDNLGLSSARNSGIRIAKGEFICFVDSDDIISERYCEVLYSLIKDTEYDFSVCSVLKFNDGDQIIKKECEKNNIEILNNLDYFSRQIKRKTEFGVWNKMYRKSILKEIKFEDNRIHEDVIWAANLADNFNSNVIMTNEKLYYYRQREGSIVFNSSNKCHPDFVYAGEKMLEIAEKKIPKLKNDVIFYTINYPWYFIDKIYLKNKFYDNKELLNRLQKFIKININDIREMDKFSKIMKFRLYIFSKSKLLYALNVYCRLFRLYIYKIFHLDPYCSGHGI